MPGTPQPVGRSSGLDRRDFIKRSALVGGLVWVSPVVRTFAAPAFAGTPVVGEGCTPGFWKNEVPANEPAWAAVLDATGVTPATKFATVFDSGAFGDRTLEEVLGLGGGGLNRLGRHAVAAWLNAASGIDYPLSTNEVVAEFKTAVAPGGDVEATADEFEAFNESDDCPWGADAELELESLEEDEPDDELPEDEDLDGPTREPTEGADLGGQDVGSAENGEAEPNGEDGQLDGNADTAEFEDLSP